ncbi:terminase [Sphingomonas oligophenolica]|uniref:Helix-turn-helix domain-containing protein n=1 Tax=Sphingomonas oligophenolica TaxID=301154 RepID=A0ABU9XXQ8_9SPHN
MRTGRPSRYKPAFVEQARLLGRLGADTADLAGFFSVSLATLYRWQARYPDFGLAFAMGRAQGEGLEKPGMFRRATGYAFSARREYRTRAGEPIAADFTVRVPADPKVALRWLRNRRPETWCGEARPAAIKRAPRPPRPPRGPAPE